MGIIPSAETMAKMYEERWRVALARIAELEAALRDCVALAAGGMGGLSAHNREPYPEHHKEIINRAQRLLGGRELT